MSKTVVIVGANLAGGRAAGALRDEGYDGRIVLVGEEPSLPYERPPLSKEMLWNAGARPDSFYLNDERFYDDQKIELRLASRVDKLDLSRQRVVLASAEEIHADNILLCTGTGARRLTVEGSDLAGVHYLRNVADSVALAARLVPGARVAIVGMGVIGSEVAASAVRLGCEVTCIEPLPVPMARILGSQCGQWLAAEHARHGVSVHLGTVIARFSGSGGRLEAVITGAGDRIPADVAVVGIGAIPAVGLAERAGIRTDNGIVVDRFCRTSVPEVYAAGDVANQPGFFGGRARLETFQNAQNHALAAAANIAGRAVEYQCVPWAWSDQYDLNIQVAGQISDSDEKVMRGDQAQRNFSMFFLHEGVVHGLVTVNRGQDMAAGKRMIERRLAPDKYRLGEGQVNLRTLLAA
ncbi:MAG: FAD-dependent oxidoreductase [Pseudomonadota bacterium]